MGRKQVLNVRGDEDALRLLLTDGEIGYRASIVLQAHEGKSARSIARSLKMGRDNVRRWIKAYQEHGISGLRTHKGGGRPSVVDDKVRQTILSLSPDFSVRDIAKKCKVGASTVQRVLAAERLTQPKPPPPNQEKLAMESEDLRKWCEATAREIFGVED